MSNLVERLRGSMGGDLYGEAADLIDEAAAFLDGLAERMDHPPTFQFGATANDCREMARKLRGET